MAKTPAKPLRKSPPNPQPACRRKAAAAATAKSTPKKPVAKASGGKNPAAKANR